MSDHEREPTSEEEAGLRRLLAEARLDGPIPREQVERLEGVLEQLRDGIYEDDDSTSPDAAVVDLAAHRRRRAGQLLFAAVTIVVAGFAIGSVVGPDDSASDSASAPASQELSANGVPPVRDGDAPTEGDDSAQDQAEPESSAANDLNNGALSSEAPGFTAGSKRSQLRGFAPADVRPVPIVDRRFASQVRNLRESRTLRQRAVYAESAGSALRAFSRWDRCSAAPWGQGTLLAVRYDRAPAVLAFREPTGSTQVVELLQCGSGDILRSMSLPTA